MSGGSLTIISIVMKQEEASYRNRCQMCYRRNGKLIFECYCIICEKCNRLIDRNTTHCQACGKPTTHKSVTVTDRSEVNKLQHLFGNPTRNLSRAMETFQFQAGVDARYIKFLQKQLHAYRHAVSEVLKYNPALQGFFAAALKGRQVERNRSSSEHTQLPEVIRNKMPHASKQAGSRGSVLPSSRSVGTGEGAFREQQPVRVAQAGQQRNMSGGYRAPSINNNTALRSNKRASQYSTFSEEDDIRSGFFHRKA